MKRGWFVVIAGVAGLTGCASPVKDVSFDPVSGTGVVAIPENTDVWPTYYRSQAMARIQSRVGPAFEIIEEQEVVVGQTTTNSRQIEGDGGGTTASGRKMIFDLTTTRDLTEYRIAFRRKAPVSVTPPGTPGTTAPVVQTQYAPTTGGSVQPAGGLVPSVAPGPVVQPAGGLTTTCPDGKCSNR